MTNEQEILLNEAFDKIAEVDKRGSLHDRLEALTYLANMVHGRLEAVSDQIDAKRARGDGIE